MAIPMQYISQILSLFKPILLILEIHLTEVSAQLQKDTHKARMWN